MKLVNKSRKKTIAKKVVFAKTPLEKLRGLMFRRKSRFDYALVFDFGKASKKMSAIHMLFVFFPIDVVYLRDGIVADVRENVLPFTPYLAPRCNANLLVELPAGSVKASGTKLRDFVDFG